MKPTLTSTSESIQIVYENYLRERYVVNRKYQRKLVWTIEEKMAFIDSIYKHYSVPIFLLAQVGDGDDTKFEIIDGMQRLNAICSFIENEFPLKIDDEEYYFDLDVLASTKSLKDSGELKQKFPILDKNICMDIVSMYQLPISNIKADSQSIEDIFRRINSFGKQLSAQEIRQAGAIGAFPDLVRKLAASIRGDSSTSDTLSLNNMKQISLTNKRLPYGIVMEDTFWVKQKIITSANMRVSRDEELIAYLLTYILLDKGITPSAHTLDKLYHYEIQSDDIASDVEDAVNKKGIENIQNWFVKIFDELANVIRQSHLNFRSLIFPSNKGVGLVRSYQIVYLAFFELMINENKYISDYSGLIQSLKGIGDKHLSNIKDSVWTGEYREEKVLAVKAVIERYFTANNSENVAIENWVSQLENLLNQSIIEGSQYDFKMGFHSLDENSKEFNKDLLSTIIKLLTATVNKGSNTFGYVIVGVGEGESCSKEFEKKYGSAPIRYGESKFYITGLNDEISAYHKNDGDKYLDIIKAAIKKEPIEDDIKMYILTHIKMVKYYGKVVLVFELRSYDEIVTYDGGVFIREGNSTILVKEYKRIQALQNIFKSDN